MSKEKIRGNSNISKRKFILRLVIRYQSDFGQMLASLDQS